MNAVDLIGRTFKRYLDAKQHLWNSYFVEAISDPRECELLDGFETLDVVLFRCLVAVPLKLHLEPEFTFGHSPVSGIRLKFDENLEKLVVDWCRVEHPGNQQWTEIELFNLSSVELQFIEYFQWNRYDYLSMNEIRCRVNEYTSRPELVGSQVIVPSVYLRFYQQSEDTER